MDDYGTDEWDDPNAYGDDWDEFDAMDAEDYAEMAARPQGTPCTANGAELRELAWADCNGQLEATRKFYKALFDLWVDGVTQTPK